MKRKNEIEIKEDILFRSPLPGSFSTISSPLPPLHLPVSKSKSVTFTTVEYFYHKEYLNFDNDDMISGDDSKKETCSDNNNEKEDFRKKRLRVEAGVERFCWCYN